MSDLIELGEEYDELYETIVGVLSIKEKAGWWMNTYIFIKDDSINSIPEYSYHYGFYRFKFNSRRKEVKVYTIMCYSNYLNKIIPLINTNASYDVNKYVTNSGLLRIHYMYGNLDYLLDDTDYGVLVPTFYKETVFDKIDDRLDDDNYVLCPKLIDTRKGLLFGIKFLLHLFGGYIPVIDTFHKYIGINYNNYELQLDYFENMIIPKVLPYECNSLNVGYYHKKCLIVLTEDAYNIEDIYYTEIFGSVYNMLKCKERYIMDFFKDFF